MADSAPTIRQLVAFRQFLSHLATLVAEANCLTVRADRLMVTLSALHCEDVRQSSHLASIPGYLDKLEACIALKLNQIIDDINVNRDQCAALCRRLGDTGDSAVASASVTVGRDTARRFSQTIQSCLVPSNSLMEASDDLTHLLSQVLGLLTVRSYYRFNWDTVTQLVSDVRKDFKEISLLSTLMTGVLDDVMCPQLNNSSDQALQ